MFAGSPVAIVCALGAVLLAGSAAADSPALLPELAWRRVWLPEVAGEVVAVARDPAGPRLALVDSRGVLLRPFPGAAFRRVFRRVGVLDVAFGAEGRLLAASGTGLFAEEGEGRWADRSPGTGDAARLAVDLAAVPGAIGVATGDGVFLSADGRAWWPLRGALPAGAATAVALRTRGEAVEVWAVVGGQLWWGEAQPAQQRLAAGTWRRLVERDRDATAGPVDVALDLPDADAAALFSRKLALRPKPGEPWRSVPLRLPPGAKPRRLLFAAGRYWLGTTSALLQSAALEGPWRRAPPPAGGASVRALAEQAPALYAATERGLLEGRPPEGDAALPGETARGQVVPDPLPPIDAVHRAALRYLALDVASLDRLRRGVSRRGWLPTLDLRLFRATQHDRSDDRDQSFVSGDTRNLHDRADESRRDLDFTVSLAWDLGDIAFHPDEVDVSREVRALLQLRDDVLDEITQLYFERLRALAERDALESLDPRARDLALRADELAAGIDTWTGGWFSAQLGAGAR